MLRLSLIHIYMVHRKKIWLNEALQISTELICAEYGKTISEEDALLHKYLFFPFASLATNAVNEGFLQLSAKQVCDYQMKVRLLSLGLAQKDIALILEQVEEASSQVRLCVDEMMHVYCE